MACKNLLRSRNRSVYENLCLHIFFFFRFNVEDISRPLFPFPAFTSQFENWRNINSRVVVGKENARKEPILIKIHSLKSRKAFLVQINFCRIKTANSKDFRFPKEFK